MGDVRVLESWKEIAAHLNRNIRTCQMWEREHGLPVHRLDGSPKARVFAYPAELDDWHEKKLHERERGSAARPHDRGPKGGTRRAGLPTLPAWDIGLIAGLAVLGIAAIGTSIWLLHRQARVRWANDIAIPEIERLLETSNNGKAYEMAVRAGLFIPRSPRLNRLWPLVAGTLSFETDPPGAVVSVEDQQEPDGAWARAGVTPFSGARTYPGCKHWKAELAGHETAEGILFIRQGHEASLKIRLDPAGSLPPGMVRVTGGTHSIGSYALAAVPAVKLQDYLLDRFEVTNGEYRAFIDAGGYRDRRYWKEEIVKDGRFLPWAEAVRTFVDSTGRPGPATWALGDYPAGMAQYPVTGVSWYEAAAYAEYAGKRLPSVFHWHYAAIAEMDDSFILSRSNINGDGLAPVGTFKGLGAFGTYDMAGNAKEWCWNKSGEKRSILGGAWNEIQYWFSEYDCYPPLLREANFGFRCMKEMGQPGTDEAAFQAVEPFRPPDYDKMVACPDDVFEVFRRLYAYTKPDLEPRVESRQDWSEDTALEKVSFTDASGAGRVIAYLFLPRRFPPPYQSVVYFPGSSAMDLDRIFDYGAFKSREVDLYPGSGRAFVFPVLAGTFERRKEGPADRTREERRERWIRLHRELARCLDYLETRPDFDRDRIAYEGLGWGAWSGPIHLALDGRFRVGILVSGGLYFGTYRPEVYSPEWDSINFAPRVKVPILMQNGIYDTHFPPEGSVRGLFRRLGTPPADKHLLLYPTGHSVWLLNEYRKNTVDFLDRYLGRPNR